jgi:hypothetical protein
MNQFYQKIFSDKEDCIHDSQADYYEELFNESSSENESIKNNCEVLAINGASSLSEEAIMGLKYEKEISMLIQSLPPQSPHRKPLLSVAGRCYKTQTQADLRLGCTQSLISRASRVNPMTTPLVNTKYPSDTKRERINTNQQLKQAKSIVEELVPEHSAHVPKMDQTITSLYNQYLSNIPNVKAPLGESYFRILTHEMRVKIQKCTIQCKYCFGLKDVNFQLSNKNSWRRTS